nr:immunoglobulin light chain junction region [Macaca mulatta]MOX74173.1 immunoglobulin light chain junction region [Macaca mulatta]
DYYCLIWHDNVGLF